jgi:hypothetical protein
MPRQNDNSSDVTESSWLQASPSRLRIAFSDRMIPSAIADFPWLIDWPHVRINRTRRGDSGAVEEKS